MQLIDVPSRFLKSFAENAGAGFIRVIPVDSQITIQAGAASLTDGFPPVTFQPVASGGTPPFGEDMNGVLQQATAWNLWSATGAPPTFDAAFSVAIGGYPKNSILSSAFYVGYFYINLVDDNLTNPDSAGAGWQLFSPIAVTTGSWQWRPTTENLSGWTKANGTTIGSAGSAATQLASAETWPQYNWLWTNFSNTLCPVSGGRGLTAAADFAANKTIQVLDMRGMAPIGMDTMGGSPTTRLTNVPVTSGSATQAASIIGENLHALILAENGPHGHSYVDTGHVHNVSTNMGGSAQQGNLGGSLPVNTSSILTTTNNVTGITISSSGSGTTHNTVGLSMTGTHYFKI